MHSLVCIQVRRTNNSTVFYSQKSFFFFFSQNSMEFLFRVKTNLDGCSLQDKEDITCLVFLAVLFEYFWNAACILLAHIFIIVWLDTLSRLVLLFKFKGVFFCPFRPPPPQNLISFFAQSKKIMNLTIQVWSKIGPCVYFSNIFDMLSFFASFSAYLWQLGFFPHTYHLRPGWKSVVAFIFRTFSICFFCIL